MAVINNFFLLMLDVWLEMYTTVSNVKNILHPVISILLINVSFSDSVSVRDISFSFKDEKSPLEKIVLFH